MLYQKVSTTPHLTDVLNRYSGCGIIGQKIQLQPLGLQFVKYLSAFGLSSSLFYTSIYVSVSIFLPCHKVFMSYVLLIMHRMDSGMLCRNGKPSYLPDVKNDNIPPPLVTSYLHSNHLWYELSPRVWLITREPSFQVAKGRVHRSVKKEYLL